MKKTYYLYAILVIALIFTIPTATRAEEDRATTNTSSDTSVSSDDASVNATTDTNTSVRKEQPRKPLIQPALIRDKMRTNVQGQAPAELTPRMKLEAEARAKLMANQASTSKERQEFRDDRREGVIEKREVMKNARMDAFKIKKDALVRQLNLSISNLVQISARISSRIDKAEQAGRDMTEAKGLLITANAKIETAKVAISAVVNYEPSNSSTNASTTVQGEGEVDLEKPREIGAVAIKAVKDAHQALVVVVRAIAQNMGVGANASTTVETNASTE